MSSYPSLASFIIFIIYVVSNPIFCQGEIYKPWNDRIFSFLPMLKNHSNQEQINSMNNDPLHVDSIHEIVELISHSVPFLKLSYWDLHLLLHFVVLYLPCVYAFCVIICSGY